MWCSHQKKVSWKAISYAFKVGRHFYAQVLHRLFIQDKNFITLVGGYYTLAGITTLGKTFLHLCMIFTNLQIITLVGLTSRHHWRACLWLMITVILEPWSLCEGNPILLIYSLVLPSYTYMHKSVHKIEQNIEIIIYNVLLFRNKKIQKINKKKI